MNLVSLVNGKLKKNYKHTKNKVDTPSQAVQEYHQKMSMIASEEIKKQPVDEREYNSITFNLDGRKIKDAKKKIRHFVDEFISEFEAPKGKSNQTYQINVQLFSLTKTQEGDKK